MKKDTWYWIVLLGIISVVIIVCLFYGMFLGIACCLRYLEDKGVVEVVQEGWKFYVR